MSGLAPYPYCSRTSETLVALVVMGTTFAEFERTTRSVLIRWSLVSRSWNGLCSIFKATPVKSTDPRLARAQFLTLKGRHAWPFRPRTNQLPVTQADCPFFPSAGTPVFAPVHDDPLHKNRSVAWAVVRGLRFWAVQSWDPGLLFGTKKALG